MTMDELHEYVGELATYRRQVPPADAMLWTIAAGLFGPPQDVQQQIEKAKGMGVPVATATQAEMAAYYKAGMPGPLQAWLKSRRSEHGGTGRPDSQD